MLMSVFVVSFHPNVFDNFVTFNNSIKLLNIFRYEDAFNRFVDEINDLASYQWWEGSVYGILCAFSYPLAWSWLQWRRKKKIQRLREFVRSEYDHACLRSCRSRALYEGLKVYFINLLPHYHPPKNCTSLSNNLVFG